MIQSQRSCDVLKGPGGGGIRPPLDVSETADNINRKTEFEFPRMGVAFYHDFEI